MNTSNFENFIVLAEERNIARAARILFMSPSTLSKQLIVLEAELGITLFKRDTNPLELTHAGMLFLETAITVTGELRELERRFSDISNNVKSTIQLGVSSMRIDCDFQHILPEFLKVYPNCCIDLSSGATTALRDQILNGELDIAVCTDYSSSDKLDYDFIQREEMLLMVSKEHPLAKRAGVDKNGRRLPCKASWFRDETFIIQSKKSPTRQIYSDFFSRVSFEPHVSITNSSTPLLLQIASHSNYCTISNEYYLGLFPDLVGFSFEPPLYLYASIIKRQNYVCSKQENFLIELIKKYYRSKQIPGAAGHCAES